MKEAGTSEVFRFHFLIQNGENWVLCDMGDKLIFSKRKCDELKWFRWSLRLSGSLWPCKLSYLVDSRWLCDAWQPVVLNSNTETFCDRAGKCCRNRQGTKASRPAVDCCPAGRRVMRGLGIQWLLLYICLFSGWMNTQLIPLLTVVLTNCLNCELWLCF